MFLNTYFSVDSFSLLRDLCPCGFFSFLLVYVSYHSLSVASQFFIVLVPFLKSQLEALKSILTKEV